MGEMRYDRRGSAHFMAVTEFTLLVARFLVLALMYLFMLALIIAIVADARAASASPSTRAVPAPRPEIAEVKAADITLTAIGGIAPATGREVRAFGPLEIGRDAACDIVIPSHFVSKRHARISPVNGQWMAEDLGSTNGSTLNGAPLTSPHPLNSGDHLTIGDTEFVVK